MNKKQRLVISKLKFCINIIKNIFDYIWLRFKNLIVLFSLFLALGLYSFTIDLVFFQDSDNYDYPGEPSPLCCEAIINYFSSEPFITYSEIAFAVIAISGSICGLYLLIKILIDLLID